MPRDEPRHGRRFFMTIYFFPRRRTQYVTRARYHYYRFTDWFSFTMPNMMLSRHLRAAPRAMSRDDAALMFASVIAAMLFVACCLMSAAAAAIHVYHALRMPPRRTTPPTPFYRRHGAPKRTPVFDSHFDQCPRQQNNDAPPRYYCRRHATTKHYAWFTIAAIAEHWSDPYAAEWRHQKNYAIIRSRSPLDLQSGHLCHLDEYHARSIPSANIIYCLRDTVVSPRWVCRHFATLSALPSRQIFHCRQPPLKAWLSHAVDNTISLFADAAILIIIMPLFSYFPHVMAMFEELRRLYAERDMKEWWRYVTRRLRSRYAYAHARRLSHNTHDATTFTITPLIMRDTTLKDFFDAEDGFIIIIIFHYLPMLPPLLPRPYYFYYWWSDGYAMFRTHGHFAIAQMPAAMLIYYAFPIFFFFFFLICSFVYYFFDTTRREHAYATVRFTPSFDVTPRRPPRTFVTDAMALFWWYADDLMREPRHRQKIFTIKSASNHIPMFVWRRCSPQPRLMPQHSLLLLLLLFVATRHITADVLLAKMVAIRLPPRRPRYVATNVGCPYAIFTTMPDESPLLCHIAVIAHDARRRHYYSLLRLTPLLLLFHYYYYYSSIVLMMVTIVVWYATRCRRHERSIIAHAPVVHLMLRHHAFNARLFSTIFAMPAHADDMPITRLILSERRYHYWWCYSVH